MFVLRPEKKRDRKALLHVYRRQLLHELEASSHFAAVVRAVALLLLFERLQGAVRIDADRSSIRRLLEWIESHAELLQGCRGLEHLLEVAREPAEVFLEAASFDERIVMLTRQLQQTWREGT